MQFFASQLSPEQLRVGFGFVVQPLIFLGRTYDGPGGKLGSGRK
jgi:hypothetical protein